MPKRSFNSVTRNSNNNANSAFEKSPGNALSSVSGNYASGLSMPSSGSGNTSSYRSASPMNNGNASSSSTPIAANVLANANARARANVEAARARANAEAAISSRRLVRARKPPIRFVPGSLPAPQRTLAPQRTPAIRPQNRTQTDNVITNMTGRGEPSSQNTEPVNNSNAVQSAPRNFTAPLSREDIAGVTNDIRNIILGKIKEKYNGVNDAHFNNFFNSVFVPDNEGAATRSSWSNSITLNVVIPEDRLDLVVDYLACQFADTYHDARGAVAVYSGPGGIYDVDHYMKNLFDSWIEDLEVAPRIKNPSARARFLGNFHTIDMLPALKTMRSEISDFKNIVRKGQKKVRRGNLISEFKKIISENVYTRSLAMPTGGGWERKFLYGRDLSEKTGVLGFIKNKFSGRFRERKYCIQSSARRPVNNVRNNAGIVIDMTQQAHGGARRVYGEWRTQKIMHISSLDDAGQGLLGENDWMKSIINQYVSMTGLDPNLASGCGTAGQRHVIDFKPFTFRMSYKTGGMEIPIIDVRMEIDKPNIRNALVRKTTPLTKVTINGISGLNMTSKSGSFGINNATMKKMALGRADRWHLQLMQKYIGDFMPIVYSFQRDVYYTTGDNMAMVQYLNMARLFKTEGVKTTTYKYIHGERNPAYVKRFTTSDVKFRMIAEDGKEGLIRLFLSPGLYSTS